MPTYEDMVEAVAKVMSQAWGEWLKTDSLNDDSANRLHEAVDKASVSFIQAAYPNWQGDISDLLMDAMELI